MHSLSVQLEMLIKAIQQNTEQLKKHNLLTKEVLDLREAAQYLSISDSTLYKLKDSYPIPYTKPNGKKVYFKKADLDAFSMSRELSNAKQDLVTAQEVVKGLADRLNPRYHDR